MSNENYSEVVEDVTDVSKTEDGTNEETFSKSDIIMPTKHEMEHPQKITEMTQSEPVTNDMASETESAIRDENLDERHENAADNGEKQDEPKEEKPSEAPLKTPSNPAMQIRKLPHKPAPPRSTFPAKDDQTDNQTMIQSAMQKAVQTATNVAQKFSGNRFQKAKSVGVKRSGSRSGAWISVINADNGNKRMSLGNKLMSKLSNPEQIQIQFSDNEIAISEFFSSEDSSFNIKSGSKGNQKIIYCAGLIDEITERFKLDFTGISSISYFDEDVFVDEDQCKPVVIIRVK